MCQTIHVAIKVSVVPLCLISSAPWQDHIPRSYLSIQLPSSSTFIGIPFLFIVSLIISKSFAFARNLLRLFTLFLARPTLHTYMRSDIVVLELSMCRRNMKDKHNTTHRDEQCWVPNSLLPFSKY